VGKNMVSAIKFWSKHTLLISDDNKLLNHNNHLIKWDDLLSDDGIDPWAETPATLWYIHWLMVYYGELTTYSWFFNSFSKFEFNKNILQKDLTDTIQENTNTTVSQSTIKRDIDCFLRNYVCKNAKNNAELLESILSELDLIYINERNETLRVNRGKKITLPIELFIYTLLVFWKENFQSNTTMSLQTILGDYNSPGRIFCLSEGVLLDYLDEINNYIDDVQISETAGMKQLVLKNSSLFKDDDSFNSKVIELVKRSWK
jgi:hypothetical protein